jgi:hypothetical protein
VPVEALEYLTDGDCASVSVQYGLLPSMFSLNKVDIAAQTFRELIDRIHARIRTLPHQPKLFLYGESLGAGAAQHGLLLSPSIVDEASARMLKADAALFVGTPGGKSLRTTCWTIRDCSRGPVAGAARSVADRDQLWFLNSADPVTRFGRPCCGVAAMAGPPPRGLPADIAGFRWELGRWSCSMSRTPPRQSKFSGRRP